MLEKVRTYIKSQHMLEKGDRIVVGVSGGADSVALLIMLQELREDYDLVLFAVHINHGIRTEALEDARYAKQLCDKLTIPFYLYEEDIPALARERKMTEEEMGRAYRYQCFYEVMEKVNANKLAVAHHMDDQAETLLFHLIRGSRLSGMAGMRPVMDLWNGREGQIIRPLLKCKKEEIIDWLRRKNIDWKEDCTNRDNIYSRNRIRNQVIPVLGEINTQAVKHMAEFAEEMAEYQEFFRNEVAKYMQEEVRVAERSVSEAVQSSDTEDKCDVLCETNRKQLMQQQPVLAKTVIYEMICKVCGKKKDISNTHVQAVYELLGNQSGKSVSLPYGMEVVTAYEMLQIRKNLDRHELNDEFEYIVILTEMLDNRCKELKIDLPSGMHMDVHLYSKKQYADHEWKTIVKESKNSKNNYTKFFECDTIEDTLCIRNARRDDYFVMNENGSTKKLSRYFIDRKIPVHQRSKTQVVAIGHKVLWIIGQRRCEEYKVTEDSELILKLMYKGE